MLDVCCIIINYNTANYTIDCVNSILSNTKDDLAFEIIVVDNASEQSSYEALKAFFHSKTDQRIKLVRSKQNVGFGAGNMLGVHHCSPCNYYAFINNDTLQISENCLAELKKFMKNTPDAGICSPQMLDEHKNFRMTIDHFSSIQREIFKRTLLELLFPKYYLKRKKTYKAPLKVHYVQGSFMFIDSNVFNEIGGFDSNLFLYYEESDVSRRFLKEKAKYTYLVPHLEYVHYKSVSITRNLSIKMEQKISLMYYIRKHYGWLHYKILIIYFTMRYFLTSIIKPKYWKIFFLFLEGAPLSKSLKNKQPVIENT